MKSYFNALFIGCLIFSLSLAACGGSGKKKKGGGEGEEGKPGVSDPLTEEIFIFSAATKDKKSQLYFMLPGETQPVMLTDNGVTNQWGDIAITDGTKIVTQCSEWQTKAHCLLNVETKSFQKIPGTETHDYYDWSSSPVFSPNGASLSYLKTTDEGKKIPMHFDIATGLSTELTEFTTQLNALFPESRFYFLSWLGNDNLYAVIRYEKDGDNDYFNLVTYSLSSKQVKVMGVESQDRLTSLARYEEGKVLLLKGDGDYYDDDSPNADLIVLKAGKDNVETPATDIRILCQGKKIVLARQQEGTVALSSYDFKTETETPIGSVESMPKSSFQCSEDDKAGFFSIGDDNKLLVMNLENGSLIRSDIGNGHPKAISPDGTYVFYLPPASNTVTSDGVTTTIIDASTQDSVGYLVETATGTKTEMTQVRRSQVVNFLDNKKLAYVKREGEIKNKMIAFDIENGSSETIAEIDWWWGMPGYPSRNFFASEVSKSYPDRIRELYVYSRESRSNFKIPVEQLVDSQMNWIQVPKGTYAKWKDFADANRATVAASLKENRPPTCTAESYENEMNAGVEMNFSLNVVDSDYEDNNNYYSEFPPFSIIQNPGDRAELSNSYFDGASGLIRSPETDTTQDLTFIFRATDSKGATGDCQMQVHIEAEDVVSCGNGILEEEEEEECDDGNMIDDDECTNACQAAPACGDAILHNREQCDDGNMNNGDGCDNTCKMEAPTGLLAISTSSTSVNLAWADYFNYETGFKIERKTGAGVFIQIIQTAANAISYTDNTGLTPGTGYIYRIRATNLAGDSAYSAVVSVTTSAPTAPAAPSAFTATPTRTSIVLTWTDNATNESSFVIQRKTSTTSYSPLTTLPVDTITYTNIGLPPSTRYYYRIKATNGTGSSVYVSNNATTLP